MRKFRIATGIFLAIFCSVCVFGSPVTGVFLQGASGSALRGANISLSGDEVTCSAIPFGNYYIMSSPGLVDYVRFVCDSRDSDHLDLQFTAGQESPSTLENWNHPLMIGFYERASVVPVQSPPHPGISIRSRNLAVENASGRFVVLAADYDYRSGAVIVTRFAATFEYVTDFHLIYPVTGTILFNFEPTNTIELSRSEVVGPTTVSAGVRLTTPAPPEGAVIELTVNQPDLVRVPSSVRIPTGETEATVPIDIVAAAESQSVEILSVYEGAGSLATLHVAPIRPPVTTIELRGDPENSLLSGTFASEPDGIFLMKAASNEQSVALRYTEGDSYWDFTFAAPAKERLHQGFFSAPGAELAGGLAYMSITAGNTKSLRNCNRNSGWFEIHDIVFDESTEPLRVKTMRVTFEHTCDVNSLAKLRGSILYNEPATIRTRSAHH